MPVSYGDTDVKCPYYSEETKNSIKCEGEFSESCTFGFKTSAMKKRHKKYFCDNMRYINCPHAVKMEEKYQKKLPR